MKKSQLYIIAIIIAVTIVFAVIFYFNSQQNKIIVQSPPTPVPPGVNAPGLNSPGSFSSCSGNVAAIGAGSTIDCQYNSGSSFSCTINKGNNLASQNILCNNPIVIRTNSYSNGPSCVGDQMCIAAYNALGNNIPCPANCPIWQDLGECYIASCSQLQPPVQNIYSSNCEYLKAGICVNKYEDQPINPLKSG